MHITKMSLKFANWKIYLRLSSSAVSCTSFIVVFSSQLKKNLKFIRCTPQDLTPTLNYYQKCITVKIC